jgi:hypothetical protein
MVSLRRGSINVVACIALISCIATDGCGEEASAQQTRAPAPALDVVPIQVDLASLPTSERAALAKIVRASFVMDSLYVRQVWPGTAALIAKLAGAATPEAQAQLRALAFFKGPWLPDGRPFITGVPPIRPPPDFYPPGATKRELDGWLKDLSAADRDRAMSPWTAIRYNADGRLTPLPYAQHYAGELGVAAALLSEAAGLTHEPSLARFLQARAHALLTDGYYESELAFVDLVGPIDVVLGPYEPDDDEWFETKTAFEASIGIVNSSATRRVEGLASHLQELEDHLPLPPALSGRKLGSAARIVVLDAVYQGGIAAAGTLRAGYGLPNDVRVLERKGARTGTYRNVLAIRYDRVFKPIADAILTPQDRSSLRFDDVLDEILMVRLFDSLGPQRVEGTGRPIAEALQDSAVVAGQIRSMLLSLWAHEYLTAHGYIDREQARSMYAAFLVPALARLRTGLSSTASQGSTYILNHLLESGAFRIDPTHHVVIDSPRARDTIVRAVQEFIPMMAAGNAPAVKALLAKYVVVRPDVASILNSLGPMQSSYLPVFPAADLLVTN